MKKNIILLLILTVLSGCGGANVALQNQLQRADLQTTLEKLPSIVESKEIVLYSNNLSDSDEWVIDSIIKEIQFEAKKTEYPERNAWVKNLANKRVQTVQGLKIKRINNNLLILSYRNGHYAGYDGSEISTRIDFPVSIQIMNKLDINENGIYARKFQIKLNLHQIQETSGGIPSYKPLDNKEDLTRDTERILGSTQQSFAREEMRFICSTNKNIMLSPNKLEKIIFITDNKTSQLRKNGVISIETKAYSTCSLENAYYRIVTEPKEGFTINTSITPDKINYNETLKKDMNVVIKIESFQVEIGKLLADYFLRTTYKFKNMVITLNQFNINSGNTQDGLTIGNTTPNYIKIKQISFHLLNKVLTQELDTTLPPYSEKNIKLQEAPKEFKDVIKQKLNENNLSIDIGVSLQYEINGKITSDYSKKSISFDVLNSR